MQRTFWTLALAGLLLILAAAPAQATLSEIFITEVVDGTLPGGVPKWIEIWNSGASAYTFNDGEGIALLSNGASDTNTDVNLGAAGSAITLQPGQVFVLSNSQPDFNSVYGFDPDLESGSINGNGDDAYAICDGSQLYDAFGEVGVDGTGEAWEYLDSYAFRTDPNSATMGWTIGEWTFGGVDVLDATPAASMLALTTPGDLPGGGGPGTLTVGSNQAADQAVAAGATNVLVIHSTFVAAGGTVSLESLDWSYTGTGPAGDIQQVSLWVDDGDQTFDSNTDTLSATYMGGGATATLTLGSVGTPTPMDLASGTPQDFFLTYDIMAGASAANISGSFTGATLGGGSTASGFPVIGAAIQVGTPVTLAVGDIQIIGHRADADDGFAFVTWVDLPGLTRLGFTDDSIEDNGGTLQFRGSEDVLVWQAPMAGIAGGTVVVVTCPGSGSATADAGEVISGNINGISSGGDQLFVFFGAKDVVNVLFGLNFANEGWVAAGGSTSSNDSLLPAALNVANGNIDLGSVTFGFDNGQYTGDRVSQNFLDDYPALIADTGTNWTQDDDGATFGVLDSTDFVAVGPPPPTATFDNPLAGSLSVPVDTETYVAGAFDATASEALNIASLVVGVAAASTGTADVTVGLAVDTDADDVYTDGTDTLLATGTLTGFAGTATLALNDPTGWDLTAGTHRLLVTISIGAGVDNGDTYIVTLESGTPTGTAVIDGLPQTGRTVTVDASLNPPTITSNDPPNGVHGNAYDFTFTVTGGSGTGYTWDISQGVQPTGLSLSTDGMLTGTPTEAATFTFTVRVTDSFGLEATLVVTIVIDAAKSDDDGGCCGMTSATTTPAGWLWLILLVLPVAVLRRRA